MCSMGRLVLFPGRVGLWIRVKGGRGRRGLVLETEGGRGGEEGEGRIREEKAIDSAASQPERSSNQIINSM